MAKSKRERRSSIRHMQETDETLRILEALDRAERESPVANVPKESDAEDLDDEREEASSR